jgi:hypothetical protein
MRRKISKNMSYKTTVVTMFFNLKQLKDASEQTRPPSFYLQNGRATLSLKFPMIVFCDEDTVDDIQKIRNEEVGNIVPTKYVVKKLQDYDFYQRLFGIIKENRDNSAFYKSNPNHRNTVSYFLIMLLKPTAIRYAHEKNFFNTSHYAWVDFGAKHVVRKHPEQCVKILENPGPRVKVCYIHYRNKQELSSMEKFLSGDGPCGIAATVWTVEATYANRYYTAFHSIFYEMLLKGVGHAEEQIMTYCYDRYPHLFTLYYGDYYSVLTNYFASHEDLHTIRWCFIEKARAAGRHDLAADAAKSVLCATTEGLVLPDDQLKFYKQIAEGK